MNKPVSLDALPRRRLGKTGVSLTALGFGGAAIGNLYAPVEEGAARDAVRAALACGIGYFDTAPHYGFGLGETRLGAVLGQAEIIVSTKVGRLLRPVEGGAGLRHGFADAAPFEPVFDYSYDGVMRAFAASLERLGRDRIDILFAHDLGALTHGAAHEARFAEFMAGGYRAMCKLREEGAVRAIGLGVNEWQVCAAAMRAGDFDGFLLAGRYTLLEQEALESFLPDCARRGIGVVIGGPFNSGILAEGASGPAPHYNYESAPPAIVARVKALDAVARAHKVPLAAAALQFPLAHPAVASVIPGMANPEQVKDALGLFSLSIPSALWDDLRREGLLRPDAPVPQAPTP